MRIHISFDLSTFRTEYTSNPSLPIASKFSRLSGVISSPESSSIDIVCGSDDCDWDNLDFLGYYYTRINDSGSSSTYSDASVSSLWIVTWQTQCKMFDELEDCVESNDFVESEAFVVDNRFCRVWL